MTFEERKAQVKSYLGKRVVIGIDRPVGYVHKKEKYSLTYPINYGYIPGVIGGDGEELDVYLLGVNEPVCEYECEIIAISHRHNDVEDKLVGAPVGMRFSKEEIAEAIRFQEQYYDTQIEVYNYIKPEYFRNLNRIEFVVTMACTGKCKHCSQGENRSADRLDKTISSDAVRKIASEYDIKSVMTFGGEPLLCVDTVCEIHKTAMQMNIPKRQLITNGYFSKDTDEIRNVAKRLCDSGVNEILLSVDAFHQETIPLIYVKEFAAAVLSTGVEIKVQPAWLTSADDDNIYNRKTKEILTLFNDMGIETNEGNIVFPGGNALKYLSEYFDMNKTYENPYNESPDDIRAICLSANGDILGSNIYKKDIMQILSEYTP